MHDRLRQRARAVLDALEALADNVESLSDEEVLTEVREEGRSPEDIAERTRSQLQDAVRRWRQSRNSNQRTGTSEG